MKMLSSRKSAARHEDRPNGRPEGLFLSGEPVSLTGIESNAAWVRPKTKFSGGVALLKRGAFKSKMLQGVFTLYGVFPMIEVGWKEIQDRSKVRITFCKNYVYSLFV